MLLPSKALQILLGLSQPLTMDLHLKAFLAVGHMSIGSIKYSRACLTEGVTSIVVQIKLICCSSPVEEFKVVFK